MSSPYLSTAISGQPLPQNVSTPLALWARSLWDKEEIDEPHQLSIKTFVNGELRQEGNTNELIWNIPALMEFISGFKTLFPGEIIATGFPAGRVDVVAGDETSIEIEKVGRLTNTVVSGKGILLSMKRARVEYAGEEHEATVNDDGTLLMPNGSNVSEDEVTWLPPRFGTVVALGLNYADHASELEFKAPEEPLIFIKSASTFIGHNQQSYRPDNIDYMHYECELVAVIGKTARKVKRDKAMDHVSGYTLCNDYAIRDYLENYYRPNLRVKSHDSLSPLGPYIIDKDDIHDPHNLALRTYVDGEVRQEGRPKT